MTGSVASASNSPERILIVGPNWLGDGIMAMPAIQTLKSSLGDTSFLHMLVKPGQLDLWDMHPDIKDVWRFPKNRVEQKALLKVLSAEKFDLAVLLPNSFRSALFPYRLGIPKRRGTREQWGRKWLVNDPVHLADLKDTHQQWENARLLLGPSLPESLPAPHLQAPEESLLTVKEKLKDLPSPWLGLIPGAARGPSKQWPGERFQMVASQWISRTGGGVCWLGTPDDKRLCDHLNLSLGAQGRVLAGSTTLKEFAAALSCMRVVLANDSGGMHLATALGTPVVGIFGITDPEKTGPLSDRATVLQHSDLRNRSVPRDCAKAKAALASISTEEATEAVLAFRDGPVKGN